MTTGEAHTVGTRRAMMAAATLAVGALLMVAAAPASASGADVPFTVTLSGVATPDLQNGTVEWVGGGMAILMGSVTTVGHVQITGPDGSCPNGLSNVNTETLTAPNGDSLTLTSVDVACPLSATKFHGVGSWTITGGTGRFAEVSGSGTSDGEADFATGAFRASFAGRLVL